MATKKWNQAKDPLYRGDSKSSVDIPTPTANDSVVRHVMYFEGPGRETPYLSTTDRREVAEYFSQKGAVWKTTVPIANASGVGHISNLELLDLMKGNGKGKAKWADASEVMTARKYVEEHSEHLLDFRAVTDPNAAIKKIFTK